MRRVNAVLTERMRLCASVTTTPSAVCSTAVCASRWRSALLALSADARWAQRLLTFELAFATLPTALWLAAPGWGLIQSWRARLGGMQNRRAAQAFVSYGIAAILANEIAIRTFDEAGWVGFRAVVPLLLQSLVLTTLMLSDTDEDDA